MNGVQVKTKMTDRKGGGKKFFKSRQYPLMHKRTKRRKPKKMPRASVVRNGVCLCGHVQSIITETLTLWGHLAHRLWLLRLRKEIFVVLFNSNAQVNEDLKSFIFTHQKKKKRV